MNEVLLPGLLLLGVAVGVLLAWLLGRGRQAAQVSAAVAQAGASLNAELAQLEERVRLGEESRQAALLNYAALKQQAEAWRDALDLARDETATLAERASRIPSLQAQIASLTEQVPVHAAEVRRLSELVARLQTEREGTAEKLQLLLQAKEALTDQFKSLAGDILEEKSKRFAEQNQLALGQLLDPLKTQLTEFKGKVEQVYVQEGKDRSALSEQVRQLVGLNQALSQDAKNLTLALKGSAKTQGNWGELVLERVLEASGLRKGQEYQVQDSQVREDGTRAQPDVVINLPEERRLVVDAKVSLLAYEQHVSAETDEARAGAIRRHLDSVRAHIRVLSEKKYQALYGLQSLDFVLMFVPVEPAFMMAVTHDGNLFMEAWERNVLLVSPSTLLFVVRTVAHLWRQEAQSRNAQDIARRGAELYDRLADFVKDLESVGSRLRQAQDAYDSAHRRLATGKGNVIRQAQRLVELGVTPTKALAAPLVESATAEDDSIVVDDLAALQAAALPPLPAFGAPLARRGADRDE